METFTTHRRPGECRAPGEDTRYMNINDVPIRPRRPRATAQTADKVAFAVTATGEHLLIGPVPATRRPVPAWTVHPDYRPRHGLTLVARLRRLIARIGG